MYICIFHTVKHKMWPTCAEYNNNLHYTWRYDERYIHEYICKYILFMLYYLETVICLIIEEQKINLMSLAILFHLLCTQHVSDINISFNRNLRLCCWIATLVVLFLVRCVLEFRCGWFGVVSVLQAITQQVVLQPATRTLLKTNRTISPTHSEPRTKRPMW